MISHQRTTFIEKLLPKTSRVLKNINKKRSSYEKKKIHTCRYTVQDQAPELMFDGPLVDLILFHTMVRNDVFYCTLVQSTLLVPSAGRVVLSGSKGCREDSGYRRQSACSQPLGKGAWPRDTP